MLTHDVFPPKITVWSPGVGIDPRTPQNVNVPSVSIPFLSDTPRSNPGSTIEAKMHRRMSSGRLRSCLTGSWLSVHNTTALQGYQKRSHCFLLISLSPPVLSLSYHTGTTSLSDFLASPLQILCLIANLVISSDPFLDEERSVLEPAG